MLESLAWLLNFTIILTDLTFIDLICHQDNLFMNYTLGSTIHPGPNAIMSAEQSRHKSRFICHFKIVALLRRIVFQ